MGTMMASLAEGLALAAQAGLSQTELLDIISLGAMANPMFKLKVCFHSKWWGTKLEVGD